MSCPNNPNDINTQVERIIGFGCVSPKRRDSYRSVSQWLNMFVLNVNGMSQWLAQLKRS